jgi:NEDD8-activating enzyme E1 regulatory subunit
MLTQILLQSSSFRDLLRSPIPYTLIIYTFPINPQILTLVERYGQLHKIPLISINCAGFYSYFRIHFPGSFPVVDTHPDSTATMDLRLLSPWPELSNFAQEMTAGIDSQDAHTHSHIPYVALLLHYLEQWKSTHDNNAPQTYADKIAFRKTVAASARTDNPEGGEENFDEACAAVLKTISVPSLSSSLREVFEYKPDRVRIVASDY